MERWGVWAAERRTWERREEDGDEGEEEVGVAHF